MIHKITIGRHQLIVEITHRNCYSKAKLIDSLSNFISDLIRIGIDNRFAGHPFSRIFRRIFERKEIKKFLGFNLVFLVFFIELVVPPTSAFSQDQPIENTVLAVNDEPLLTENSIRIPLNSFQLSQGYSAFHLGIDLNESEGAPVYPVMSGKVEKVVSGHFSYGNYILINHSFGFKSLYAHLAKITVAENEVVNQNTIIGTVGHTGQTTGSHLHLEVYENNRPFNPLIILRK